MDGALIGMTTIGTGAPLDTQPVRLEGSRCAGCPVVTYPAAAGCPRCGGGMDRIQLSEHGAVWTWTVQRFVPKSPPYVPPPGGFAPFAVGYVELPEGVRVAAVIKADPERISIGMPVRVGVTDGVPRATPSATSSEQEGDQ